MNYKLLLIEDDPIFTFLLEKGIKQADIKGEIHNFLNGEPAVAYLSEHYSDDYNFIFFLDLNMPIMNGWEFMEQLTTLAKTNNCMVFILTSSAYQGDIETLKNNPFVADFVTKPITQYNLNSIKEKIEENFEKK